MSEQKNGQTGPNPVHKVYTPYVQGLKTFQPYSQISTNPSLAGIKDNKLKNFEAP